MDEIKLVLKNAIKERADYSTSVGESKVEYSVNNATDSEFMERFASIINEQYSDPDFSREKVAKQMFVETRTLSRKLNVYSGISFGEHLKKVRLENAKLSILSGAQVSEACYEVGFNNLSHFSTAFKKEYGFAPSKLVDVSRVRQ
jgi:AraC-like DNA-binding protein